MNVNVNVDGDGDEYEYDQYLSDSSFHSIHIACSPRGRGVEGESCVHIYMRECLCMFMHDDGGGGNNNNNSIRMQECMCMDA